jgi:transposase-like protein
MITDKLGSYAAAQRQIMPEVEHRLHKGLIDPAWEILKSTTGRTRSTG